MYQYLGSAQRKTWENVTLWVIGLIFDLDPEGKSLCLQFRTVTINTWLSAK